MKFVMVVIENSYTAFCWVIICGRIIRKGQWSESVVHSKLGAKHVQEKIPFQWEQFTEPEMEILVKLLTFLTSMLVFQIYGNLSITFSS